MSFSRSPQPQQPLTVAIMMLTLVKEQMGGTEVYARSLVQGLAERADPEFQFVAIYANNRLGQDGPVLLNARNNYLTEHVLARVHTGVSRGAKLRLWLKTLLHRRRIWRDIEKVAGRPIDMVLFPFSAVQPKPRRQMRTVTIIHDLQHRDLPQGFSRGQLFFRWWTYERAARFADAIITVSDFTKTSIIRILKVHPDLVHRIYPGLDKTYRGNSPLWQPGDHRTSGFLYYPARSLRHKNHSRLFEAVALVRQEFPNLTLRLSGSEAHLLGELPPFVQHEGNISGDEILALYQECAAVVFPSTYEGFGFPVLEALALGAPLVLSDQGSLPEVALANAFFVDPFSVESIAEGIRTALLTKHNPQQAREHAHTFTWEATIDRILATLRAVGRA